MEQVAREPDLELPKSCESDVLEQGKEAKWWSMQAIPQALGVRIYCVILQVKDNKLIVQEFSAGEDEEGRKSHAFSMTILAV